MAMSGISAASFHPAAGAQSSSQLSAAHKQGGRHPHSLSDIDIAGSSAASPPSPTGKIGSRINITA